MGVLQDALADPIEANRIRTISLSIAANGKALASVYFEPPVEPVHKWADDLDAAFEAALMAERKQEKPAVSAVKSEKPVVKEPPKPSMDLGDLLV